MQISRSRWRHPHIQLTARLLIVTFGILGLVPLEVVIPPIAGLFDHLLFIFKGVSLYFVLYVTMFSIGLRIVWFGDRHWLGQLQFPFGRWLRKCLRIPDHRALWLSWFDLQYGRMFVKAFGTVGRLTYDKRWPLAYRLWYYISLIILGLLPYAVKFGICMVTLRPNWQSYLCLFIGTTIRSYLLVYLGADLFQLIF